ncbi:hypothetical protein MIR68_010546 [Amoeboaphelidium protococcarum]|nr:hypothetical protein MIR68_010546 [Amoeboaphelidium protococcarum]
MTTQRSTGGSANLKQTRNVQKKTEEQKRDGQMKCIFERLGGEQAAMAYKDGYLKANEVQSKESKRIADGMIVALFHLHLSQGQIRLLLGAGSSRIQKLYKVRDNFQELAQKAPQVPKHAFKSNDIQIMKDFIQSLEVEDGYPCAHRRARTFLKTEGSVKTTWESLYQQYVAFAKEKSEIYVENESKIMAQSTFSQRVQYHFPGFRLDRSAEDVCNHCSELEIALLNPDLSDLERQELLRQQTMHLNEAAIQRRFMKAFILEYSAKNGSVVSVPEEQFEHSLEENSVSDMPVQSGSNCTTVDDTPVNGSPKVLICAEDFGGSLTLPHYGYQRPQVDYFNSNLILQNFIISDITTGMNNIVFYDERLMGKDGNAMCNLRINYHLQRKGQYDTLLCIMDNCVGQNKSQVTMRFAAMLSIILYKRVALLFLQPGHSHMMADRAVAWMKSKIRNKNLYVPEQFVAEVSQCESLVPTFLDHRKDDAPCFTDWKDVLDKYFKRLPDGFTGNYFFEFVDGVCTYRRLCSDEDCVELDLKKMASNLIRQYLPTQLFGSPDINQWTIDQIKLPKQPIGVLKGTKLKSLAEKYFSIPIQFRGYYPQLTPDLIKAGKEAAVQNRGILKVADQAIVKVSISSDNKVEDAQATERLIAVKKPVGRPSKPVVVDKRQTSILSFVAKKVRLD